MSELAGQRVRRKALRSWEDLYAKTEERGILLPSSPVMERSVLGSAMIDPKACDRVIDLLGEIGLEAPVFYDERHQVIYMAITNIHARGIYPDIALVSEECRRMLGSTVVTPVDSIYIADLTKDVITTANVESHVRVVLDRFIERSTVLATNKAQLQVVEGTMDILEVIQQLESQTGDLAAMRNTGREVKSGEQVSATVFKDLDAIDKRTRETGNSVNGVSTGLTDLDAILPGFQKTDYIVIGGRPSMGKSALGAHFAVEAAVHEQAPTLFFTLEMSAAQMMLRMLCQLASVEMQRAQRGKLTEDEWKRIARAQSQIAQSPLHIDESQALTVSEIRRRIRRLSRSSGKDVRMVFIDYMTLLAPPPGSPQYMKEFDLVNANSPKLKSLAKELEISLFVMSQLSREVEKRNDKRPMLSDLRASGSIEQDADIILFPYRGEYYGETVGPDNNPTEGVMEIDVAKDRNGPTGTVYSLFRKETGEICDRPIDWDGAESKFKQETLSF